MKIPLTKDECSNVKVALLALAKSPNVNEESMTVLLILARKFDWVEEAKKEETKDGSKPA